MKEEKKDALAVVKKNITDQVLTKVNALRDAGELMLHKDYIPENALKSAYLILAETVDMNKKPVLESCSKESIANSLLSMIVQGLSPIKKQFYFIPYAGKLEGQRSYLGAIAIIKRDAGAVSVVAQAVHAKDKFLFTIDVRTGIKQITAHEQSLESLDSAVTAAYCIITFKDETKYVEVMTIDQITAAWNQRKGNGLSPAHQKFPAEMAKKTVINRACKQFINTLSDEGIYDESKSDKAKDSLEQEIEETEYQELDIELSKSAFIDDRQEVDEDLEKQFIEEQERLLNEEQETVQNGNPF